MKSIYENDGILYDPSIVNPFTTEARLVPDKWYTSSTYSGTQYVLLFLSYYTGNTIHR